jgi:hypothetical protein
MVIFIQDTQELAFPVAVMQSAMEANVAYYHEHRTPLNVLAVIAKSALPIERAAALTALNDAITWDLPLFSESELRETYTRLRKRYFESGEGLQAFGLQLTQKIGVILNDMADSHVCQNCGGDDRVGSHWRQLDADWFVCNHENTYSDEIPF